MIRRLLPGFIDKDRLYDLLGRIVDLSAEGLKERGYGEEAYLAPLYDRVDRRETPADHMLNALADGKSVEELIIRYT